MLAKSATKCHLPSISIRIKSSTVAAADFRDSLKEFRVENRNKVLWAQGKTGRTGLQIVRYFQETTLWAPSSCISSYVKNTKILHGDDCSLWLAETFCKNPAWLHIFPLYQNHLYTDLLPCRFGAVSQSYLRCWIEGYCPHFALRKT